MTLCAIDPQTRMSPMLLAGGVVILFACSRVLADMLGRRGTIGMRAVAHFLPIAAVALLAMVMGHPQIAVAVIFGTSVGAMTTAVGFISIAEPIAEGPQRWRRLWGLVLAVALIVFIAGFKGDFRWRDAAALMVEGAVVAVLWHDEHARGGVRSGFEKSIHSIGVPVVFASDAAEPRDNGPDLLVLGGELALAGAAIGLGSWLAIQGVSGTAQLFQQPMRMPIRVSSTGIAASLLSLSLVLPMSYGAWRRSAGGHGWQPMTTQVAILVLNLCLLLPIIILMPYLAAWAPGGTTWAKGVLTWGEGIPRFVLFPVSSWRIDNVILIVVGILLLPVSFGKWSLGKEEGLILIAGYFFYLTAVVALG